MPTFSFDIVSDYDKAEMNNMFTASERELATRYDFKGTPASIEWLDNKTGIRIIGANTWQCEAILDIVRKKLAARNQSSKVLDLSKDIVESNMKATWDIPFKHGMSQDQAKETTRIIREHAPKAKPQIQGDTIRVSSSSKDELQKIISLLKEQDFDFPLQFINYR